VFKSRGVFRVISKENNLTTQDIPLFWQDRYTHLQSHESVVAGVDFNSRFVMGRGSDALRTWTILTTERDLVRSPCRATFGGFWTRDAGSLGSDVTIIVNGLADTYRHSDLVFYLAPEILSEFKSDAVREVLESLGATVDYVDLDFSIDVQSWSEAEMSKGNRKKLRQWREVGGTVRRVQMDTFDIVYEIVLQNRLSLGVKPSISSADLRKLMEQFPEHYSLYLAEIAGEPAACAVTIDLSKPTKYVFFWADRPEHRNFSPVVAVCAELIAECTRQSKPRLDLGISTEMGRLNPGLIRFKQNLGASESSKYQLRIKSSNSLN
jgi:hypothetical protein